jgi:hypothetical protein
MRTGEIWPRPGCEKIRIPADQAPSQTTGRKRIDFHDDGG